MHNLFITQDFDWDPQEPRWARWLNGVLRRIGVASRIVSPFTGYMTTTEQRMNLFLLLEQVLAHGVPGAVVEVGSHGGVTATLLMRVLMTAGSQRALHLFDAFESPAESVVIGNFRSRRLPEPVIHKGWLSETMPGQLPESIAFAHVDLGPGRSPDGLREDILHVLHCLYPRMNKGAVAVLQDYCDPTIYARPGFHFPGKSVTGGSGTSTRRSSRPATRSFSTSPSRCPRCSRGGTRTGSFGKSATDRPPPCGPARPQGLAPAHGSKPTGTEILSKWPRLIACGRAAHRHRSYVVCRAGHASILADHAPVLLVRAKRGRRRPDRDTSRRDSETHFARAARAATPRLTAPARPRAPAPGSRPRRSATH